MSRHTNDAALREPLEQTEAPLATVPETSFAYLALESIRPSQTNPRGKADKAALIELTESVRRQGVLMPILVRTIAGAAKDPFYELVAGHRRWAAAKAAGLETIPATIRELTNVEALEIQLLENLQRSDLTPIEEAEGYQQLAKAPGYDVARVAEKVGRSVKYVYDRMKLLALGKDARALLEQGVISAGHAILLARLKPADQARAIKEHALLEREQSLFDSNDGETLARLKAVSVRELNGWIDQHVRMDPEKLDPMLFPEAALKLEQAPKVVGITTLHYVPEEARDGKTIFPQSWERADGREGSKKCEFSTLGFVVVGPRRGEAFEVCTAKDKCTVHWADKIREKKRREKLRASTPAAPAKKTESPETAARKAALEKALDAARTKADEERDQQLATNAAACNPETFIRTLARAMVNDLRHVLDEAGERVKGSKDIEAWAKRAPLAQVQRAVALSQTEFYDDELFECFGVDPNAIEQRHEQQAREAFKAAQTSAPKPAKKAATKKAKA